MTVLQIVGLVLAGACLPFVAAFVVGVARQARTNEDVRNGLWVLAFYALSLALAGGVGYWAGGCR